MNHENNQSEIEDKTDAELVDLVLEDKEFFVYLINRYKFKLASYIKRISASRDEDVEDILQEVFIKVYLNLNDFDQDLKFSSWIYRITHNHVISEHRKLQARPQNNALELDEVNAKNIAAELNIEKELDTEILRENIYHIFDKLDEKYSNILILKFFEEKSYKEISDIIKKPMGTVASMMNKAKKEFKSKMKN